MDSPDIKKERSASKESWWNYDPPPTAYDLVGNNYFIKFLRPLTYFAVHLYFKERHSIKVEGWRREYSQKPFIIASNHSSHMDTPLIFSCFPFSKTNNVRTIAALDYFFSNYAFRNFSHLLCNLIPINRSSADMISISMCEKTIKANGTLIIYPEGTRTRDGTVGDFKPGIGLIVQKTRIPVIPVCIKGSFACFNYRHIIPKPGKVSIKFGTPMKFGLSDASDPRKITEAVRDEVIKLSKSM